MALDYLIGLTTNGGWFQFNGRRPEPLFPEPLPDQDLVFIAESLVPADLPVDRYSVIPVETFGQYVSELKSYFDAFRAQMVTDSLSYRLREEVLAEVEQRVLNPEQTARIDQMLRSMWAVFRTKPGVPSSIEERVYQAVTTVLDEPLTKEDFHLPPPAREHVDQMQVWPGKKELGVSRYLPMAVLITDVHIAGKENVNLLTNEVTRRMLSKAERFLEHLERNDLAGYLTE